MVRRIYEGSFKTGSLDQVKADIDNLARINEVPIYTMKAQPAVPAFASMGATLNAYVEEGDLYHREYKYKGLATDPSRFADKQGNPLVVSVVGHKMPVPAHQDVFNLVVDKLADSGINNVDWHIYESAKKTTIEFKWPGQEIVPADGNPIKLGLYTTHGFGDKSFGVGAFGYRVICGNGMVVKELIPMISVKHTGVVETMLAKIGYFLSQLSLRGSILTEHLNAAMEVELTNSREVLIELAKDVGYKGAYPELIADNAIAAKANGEILNYLDMYNAATNTALRGRTFNAQFDNSAVAENILTLPAITARVNANRHAVAVAA